MSHLFRPEVWVILLCSHLFCISRLSFFDQWGYICFTLQHNQPIEIIDQKMYAETVYYIHQNPVVSGFVYEAEQWVYNMQKDMQRMIV